MWAPKLQMQNSEVDLLQLKAFASLIGTLKSVLKLFNQNVLLQMALIMLPIVASI